MKSLTYRHNGITRLTHWINALALLILFMSGLQIFNAFPNLHWGDKAEPEEAFFSISASTEEGELRGHIRLYGWKFETTGILGVQETLQGPFPRAFPSWITIPGFFWLADGRRWHFFFAWIFVLNGLFYLLYNLAGGQLRRLIFGPRDIIRIPSSLISMLHFRRAEASEEEYTPLQKLAYTVVVFIFTPLVILSGLAMSPQLNVAFNWLPEMFGGRQSARTFHFLATVLFALFSFGHVFLALIKGPINNMRAIITGWYAVNVPEEPEFEPMDPTPRITRRRDRDPGAE